MPLYGLEVTALLHDAGHRIRRAVRDGCELGMPPEAIEDVVRSNMAVLEADVLRLPVPCGRAHCGAARCERERGHEGECRGSL